MASTTVAPPVPTPDATGAPGSGAQARTPRRPPRAVLVATLLFGLVTALWTVAVPAFRAPDEAAHLDLILYLADGNGYPRYDGRYFGEEVNFDTDRYLVKLTEPWPVFDAADATPRGGRPDVDDLGIEPDAGARKMDTRRAGYPYVYNQMPQHPPVYYVAQAAVLRFERWVLPGHGIPSMDRELGLLRLMDVLMVMPLPLLAWATVRRMGGSDRAGTVASLLPLGVPQLMHIGAAITNDALFMLLGGILAVLLAGVGRGVRTRRTDLAVGVVLGVAMLTKAFAIMFVPWVAVAYGLAAWTARRWRPLLDGAVAGAVGAAVGAWWWVLNWVRIGEPAPTTETLTRTTAQQPEGFEPDALRFLLDFPGRLLSRTWAWVGHGTPKFELPGVVVGVLTVAVVTFGVVAYRAARRGRGTEDAETETGEADESDATDGAAGDAAGDLALPAAPAVSEEGPDVAAVGPGGGPVVGPGVGPRRVDILVAWLPALLVALFVARRSVGLYETTGKVAFIQGRYLFGALVPPIAVLGIGVAHKLGRAGPLATLAVVAVLQVAVLGEVVASAWSGPGFFGPVRGALAWSPWPPLAVGLVAASALAATVWLVADGVRGTRLRPVA